MHLKVKFRTNCSLFFLSICLSVFCEAQDNSIKFHHITTENGLSPGNVHAICQDKLGFIWIGTSDGLSRYDGKNIVVYEHNPDNTNSLLSNQIRSIFEDSKGDLWVGTTSGLNLFDRNNNQFLHKKEWPERTVNCIFEDKDHVLWIGQYNYLHSIDLNTNICKYYSTSDINDTLPGNRDVYAIIQDSWQNIWFATTNGIFVLNKKNKRFYHYYPDKNVPDGLNGSLNHCLWQDTLKRIWIGTQQGVTIITNPNPLPQKLKCLHIRKDGLSGMEHGEVNYLFTDKNDNLYLSTINDGLFILKNSSDPKNLQFPLKLISYKYDPDDKFGINSKGLNMVMQDNQNTIWIAASSGVHYFNSQDSKFELISKRNDINHSIIDNNVNTFLDEKEYLWIGTENGLSRYNKKTKHYTHFRHNSNNTHSIGSDAVYAIYRDKQNQLWIGCWNGGLNLFNEKTQTFQVYKHDINSPSSISSNNVFTIFEDSKNRFWIGTIGGHLNLFDRANKTFSFPRKEKAYYEQIIEISDGELWMVNADDGWDVYDPEKNEIKKYSSNSNIKKNLSSYLIYTVFIDSKKNLWVGTDNGLNLYQPDKDQFRHFQIQDGLPDNAIKSIVEDNQGNLWLGTYKGISKFQDAVHLPAKIIFKNYTKADGLQSNNFRKRSAIRGIDGRLYFGGNNGFNIINTDSLRNNTFISPIVFTELTVLYQPIVLGKKDCPIKEDITVAKKIELKHWQSAFNIKFAALSYIGAKKNQYAYKLEGFDKDWNYVGSQNEATYTNLESGKYVFKVIASNNDGYWNSKGKEIVIIVDNPWWKSIWAKLLALLTLIIIIRYSGILLIRLKKVKDSEIISEIPDTINFDNNSPEVIKEFSQKHHEKTPSILIVEDNVDECEAISALLRNNYEVYTATNGKEGLRLAEKYLPSLIIADILIPKFDEFEICRRLKKNFYTSHIPIIILTRQDSDKYKIKGLKFGADEFMSKPYKPSVLNARIKNMLESRNHLQKRIINDVKIQPSEFNLSDPDEAFLSKAIQIIEDNINSVEFDVSKLAEHLNITSITLYRKLKALTGQSINQFIRSIRLKRAACLLETKKYSVQDIAFMVGFNDTKYFRKCFQKQFGFTPSEYNNQNNIG